MPRSILGTLERAEIKLKMQALFNQVNDAIFIVNEKGMIMVVNQAACKLTGYEETEILEKPISAVILEHQKTSSSELPQAMAQPNHEPFGGSQENRKYEADLLTRDGHRITIEVSHILFPQEIGTITCVIAKNISEQVISKTLQETSSTLSSSLNEVEVFDHILDELHKLIPYDGGNIMLVAGRTVHISRTFGYDRFGETFSDSINALHFNIESTENIRRIVKDQKPLILADTHKISYWLQNEAYELFHSWIGVPIIIDGIVDAFISLDKIEPNFFTEEHASVLTIFSNQAASAIKNARLFEAESRRIQQLDGLQSTLSAINSKRDLNTLLHEIVSKAIYLLNASMGELALYDPEKDQLRFIVSQNIKKDNTGLVFDVKEGLGIFSKVAATKSPMKVDRFSDVNDRESIQKFLGSQSGLAVPLLADKELLGVLGIADQSKHRVFDENDMTLLNTFAQQATIAITNCRLYEDANRRAEEAETIQKAGAVVTSSLKQSEAIDLILEQLASVVPFDIAAVLLKKHDNLAFIGGRGFNNLESTLKKQLPLSGNTPAAAVFLQKIPLIFDNIPMEFPDLNVDSGGSAEIKSWLGAPLIIQEKTIGVIFLNSYESDRFNQHHIRLLAAFADQVAISLENARLYSESVRSAERFETLYQLGQTISANIHSENIYPAIHQAVSELMTTEFFSISLYNSETNMIEDVYTIDDGELQSYESRPMGEGLISRVLKDGKALLFDSFDQTKVKESGAVIVGNLEDERISQSILMVPLKIGISCIGVLSAQSYMPNMYNNNDRETLELLASTVAIAIENSLLFDEVQHLATIDPLTKLFNRRKFEELCVKEFDRSRRYHHPMCLIMIDLDQFKQVNDTYGHVVGDQALTGLATLCKNNLRNNDVFARVGGEEFMILLPETTSKEAMITAERLRQDCEKAEFSTNQGTISFTISLGVVQMDDESASLEELVEHVDQALYTSKNLGRNKSTLWSHELAQTNPSGSHTH